MAIRRKVCLLGAPGVGKTSLVRRFVSQTFSEEYLTTLGVKIERRTVDVDGVALTLLVWDVHGEEGSLVIRPAFLKGAVGILLVVDGARPETAFPVVDLAERLGEGPKPPELVVATNKADLVDDWKDIDATLGSAGLTRSVRTSAATGAGVEEAFDILGRAVLAGEMQGQS